MMWQSGLPRPPGRISSRAIAPTTVPRKAKVTLAVYLKTVARGASGWLKKRVADLNLRREMLQKVL